MPNSPSGPLVQDERKLCWRVIRRCNLSCPHCLAGNLDLYSDEVDTGAGLRFVDCFAECGVTRVVFTGGEPLLRHDLFELLARAKRRGISTQITTNGLGLTSDRLNTLRAVVDVLRVSVDGFRETHNRLRGSNNFDTVLRNAVRAVEIGFDVCINTIVLKDTIEEIPALIRLLSDHGLRTFVLLELMLREHGTRFSSQRPLPAEVERLNARLHGIALGNPSLSIRFNRYSIKSDRYVVVEADGSVVLCSEAIGDRVIGSMRDGTEALDLALQRQRLSHRELPSQTRYIELYEAAALLGQRQHSSEDSSVDAGSSLLTLETSPQ